MLSERGDLLEKRKLATILSLDVVGYSAAAERDDSAAAEGVRSLRAAINEIVAPFGGRIFSSAGDGFMLEFPVATAGVQAGMALLSACKSPTHPLPQIRIGMHLGEVIVEEHGDLLGHGVNIAARLQQRTLPGAMIVSEDVRHSVRGELASQLRPLGTIQLDKMSQRIAIYGFGAGPILRRARLAPRTLAIVAGALAIAAVAAIVVLSLNAAPATCARTAVFTLSTPTNDAPAQALASGIANEIVDAMSEMGLEPISRSETNESAGGGHLARAQSLHAAYALDGDVARDGDVVRVSVRLDDVNAHQTVWAQTFDRDAARMAGLRLEIATAAVNVLHCASEQRAEIARMGKAPLAILLRVCAMTDTAGNQQEYLQLTRQLAAAAPRSSLAQGLLAFAYYSMADLSPAPLQAQMYARAATAADTALRLNPHESHAAAIKATLLSAHQTRIEHERTLLQYLRLSPDGTFLNIQYAELLRSTGRTEEAVAYIERAYALNPLSPYVAGLLGWMRAVAGRSDEAKELLDSMAVRWPEAVQDIGWARFRTSVWFGSKAEALRLLEDNGTLFSSAERACWRTVIDGMSTANAAARRQAASEVRRCQLDPSQTFQILASLGDTDGAFATADALISAQRDRTFTGIFFVPAAAAVRRDPRFMPLMHRAGLADYWLQSGHWPDFCADPQLPYNCRAEAVHLSGQR